MPNRCASCGQLVRKPRTVGPPRPETVATIRRHARRQLRPDEIVEVDRFAGVLRHLRAQTGLSRAHLADLAGLSASYVRDLEFGAKRPRIGTVLALAAALEPAPPRYTKDHREVTWPGDPQFRLDFKANPKAMMVQMEAELLEAIGDSIAPSKEQTRAIYRKP